MDAPRPAQCRRSLRAICRIAGTVALMAVATATFGQAEHHPFSIPAQPLSSALLQLAHQANISIAFNHALVADKNVGALQGNMDVDTALKQLLAASGLTFEFVRPGLARIIAAPPPPVARATPVTEPAAQGVMEEVTVTARRRPESSDRVPISMSVVQGEALAAANLNDVEDLAARIPSLQFRPNPTQKDRTVFIRGIGTISTSQSTEPSVATVIDGVVMSRSGQAMADFLDLDQIEVLNGPQGTLFGKNASAGVLNITTREPTDYLSGFAQLAYYQGNEYRISGGISGPLSETVAARIAVFDSGFDGNMKNRYNGREVNGYHHTGARAKLVVTPNDTLKFTLSADFIRSKEDVPGGAFTSSGQIVYCPSYQIDPLRPNLCTRNEFVPIPYFATVLAAQGIEPSKTNRTISNESLNETVDRNGGASLQADWQLGGDYLLTSITAWRQWRNWLSDYDYDQLSPDPLTGRYVDFGRVVFTQKSQELRLTSPRDRYIDFVAGLYFMSTDNSERYRREVSGILPSGELLPFGYGVNNFGSTNRNYAVYGEMNFNFAPRFRAFLGYRRIWDRIGFYSDRVGTVLFNFLPAVSPDFAASGDHDAQGWAGRAGVQWDLTPDVMAYVTVSRGYKGPAYNVFFNMRDINTHAVDPERSDAYEIGVKTRWWNRRLRLDAAAFDTEISGYQANLPQLINGTRVTNLVNAGSAFTRGFQLSVAAAATSRLSYNLDAQYDEARVRTVPCDPPQLQCSFNGNTLPFAPKWRVSAAQDYQYPLSSTLNVGANIAYRWQSLATFQFTNTPDMSQPAYGIWDLSLGLRDSDDRWSTALLVKNLLDKEYSSYLAQGDLAGVVRWIPRDVDRYVGVNAQFNF